MPRPPIVAPLIVPVVVMIVAPPTPPKKADVPLMPTAPSAAPTPAPITGASRPADSPMTRPPPKVASPIIIRRLLREESSRFFVTLWSSSDCTSSSISSASVIRFSNLVTSIHVSPTDSATCSNSVRERASYTLSAVRTRNKSHKTVQRRSSVMVLEASLISVDTPSSVGMDVVG